MFGWADRYGGIGVGRNGGSGRNVVINGLQVKGIGRTPLLGQGVEIGHASGGCYFEEALRETIFAEIVAAEFPHGAVPVLALIDTGLVQQWHPGVFPTAERRVLMVRPAFLRCAHFERAFGFDSSQLHEGMRDTARVRAMFEGFIGTVGNDAAIQTFTSFGIRLAEQIGYGFAHRLAHSSVTSSNAALDGRLLDFGAMTALPTWADIATMLTRRSFERQFDPVGNALQGLRFSAARYGQLDLPDTLSLARRAFKATVTSEVLRVLGASNELVSEVRQREDLCGAWPPVAKILLHFQHEKLDFAQAVSEPRLVWDVDRVWDESPPQHLRAAKAWLQTFVGQSERSRAMTQCQALSRPRMHMARQSLRSRLHAALGEPDMLPNEDFITDLINREVESARRDLRP